MATFTSGDLTLGSVAVVRILGIDPGTQVVGFGCLELAGGALPGGGGGATGVPLAMRGSNVVRAAAPGGAGAALIETGVLRLGKRGAALTDRLLTLSREFAELVRELSRSRRA